MKPRYENLASMLRIALIPIFAFALVNALICWFAAWIFWERYEFSAICLGVGCGGIVISATLNIEARFSYRGFIRVQLSNRDAGSPFCSRRTNRVRNFTGMQS